MYVFSIKAKPDWTSFNAFEKANEDFIPDREDVLNDAGRFE